MRRASAAPAAIAASAAARRSAPTLRARRRTRSGMRQVGRELEREQRVVEPQAPRACRRRPARRRAARAGRRGRRDSFSSRAEHSMPWLSTPRSLPTLIRNGLPSSAGGSSAPTSASGTLMPARAFGAPQTICSSVAPARRHPPGTRAAGRRSGAARPRRSRADHDAVNGGATGRSVLDLHAGHGQQLGQLLRWSAAGCRTRAARTRGIACSWSRAIT